MLWDDPIMAWHAVTSRQPTDTRHQCVRTMAALVTEAGAVMPCCVALQCASRKLVCGHSLSASAKCRVSFNRQQRIRSYKENAPQLTLSSVAVKIGSMGPPPPTATTQRGAARGEGSQEPAVLQLVVEASYRNCSVSLPCWVLCIKPMPHV